MNKLYLVGAIVLAVMTISLGSFFIGMQHQQLKQEREQVKVLHGDAKKSIELEKAHEKRKATTERSVQVIQQTVDDCVGRRVPDRILDELRAPGGPARPTSDPRLREAGAGG